MEVVKAYLNSTKLPDSTLFNPRMRAYPDVAAMSDDFWIIINRLMMNVAGTSVGTENKLFTLEAGQSAHKV